MPGLEFVFNNAHNNFTLQYPLILAPLRPDDDDDTANRKIRLVAGYIDIFIARRVVNFRTLGYSLIVYTMFQLMRELRKLPEVAQLAEFLTERVHGMEATFDGVRGFRVHQQNRYHVHHLLARLIHHVETECGVPSHSEDYVARDVKKPFEIEHVWGDRFDRHQHDFASEDQFQEYRNRFGGLILLPRGFNQSLGDAPFEKKVDAYFGQNLLARSLNARCYQNNPSFLAYTQRSGLPFKPYGPDFTRADLDERQELYRQLCDQIWHPDRFARELA